jgi:hypothetical protein
MDEILEITPPPLPYSMDDKIFIARDEEGSEIGEPYSLNDWLKQIQDISGVSLEEE